MIEITREEHIDWCKRRAMQYVELGDLNQAFASLASDLRKHPQTQNHIAVELGFQMLINGHLNTKAQMREFIEGVQ